MTGSSPERVDGEFDLRQHPVGVGVGDEQRPPFPCGTRGELVPVDETDAGFDRVDAEPCVGHVEERHRGANIQLDVRVCAGRAATLPQVPHRSFEHEGRSGNGVDDLAVLPSGVDQHVGDLDIDVVERVGRLVQMVERRCVRHDRCRRVATGAQEPCA